MVSRCLLGREVLLLVHSVRCSLHYLSASFRITRYWVLHSVSTTFSKLGSEISFSERAYGVDFTAAFMSQDKQKRMLEAQKLM